MGRPVKRDRARRRGRDRPAARVSSTGLSGSWQKLARAAAPRLAADHTACLALEPAGLRATRRCPPQPILDPPATLGRSIISFDELAIDAAAGSSATRWEASIGAELAISFPQRVERLALVLGGRAVLGPTTIPAYGAPMPALAPARGSPHGRGAIPRRRTRRQARPAPRRLRRAALRMVVAHPERLPAAPRGRAVMRGRGPRRASWESVSPR